MRCDVGPPPKQEVLDKIYNSNQGEDGECNCSLCHALEAQRIRESVQNEMVSDNSQDIRRSGRNKTVGKGSKDKQENFLGSCHGRCKEFYPD